MKYLFVILLLMPTLVFAKVTPKKGPPLKIFPGNPQESHQDHMPSVASIEKGCPVCQTNIGIEGHKLGNVSSSPELLVSRAETQIGTASVQPKPKGSDKRTND